MNYDYLIIGMGFSGITLANKLANDGNKILIIDKRNHIGGNSYDYYNIDGILIHKYGPHIFHTNSEQIWEYLSQFTSWYFYTHKVLAQVDNIKVPIPINKTTINKLYGLALNEEEMQKFYDNVKISISEIKNSQDVVLSKVGKDLYEKFFKNYTKKQWDLYPSELGPEVTSRIPIRVNDDDRYFTDKYQGLPLDGYTIMFEKMLNSKNIHIKLNTNYNDTINKIKFNKMIYTGPIDEYFGYKFGKLPYRSLDFKFETFEKEKFQEIGVINYPNEFDFTRITEFKYLTGQTHKKTTIVKEYSKSDGDPYYPIPKSEYKLLYKKYEELAKNEKNVYFVGRLATYKYYNMDQCVAVALTLYQYLSNKKDTHTT